MFKDFFAWTYQRGFNEFKIHHGTMVNHLFELLLQENDVSIVSDSPKQSAHAACRWLCGQVTGTVQGRQSTGIQPPRKLTVGRWNSVLGWPIFRASRLFSEEDIIFHLNTSRKCHRTYINSFAVTAACLRLYTSGIKNNISRIHVYQFGQKHMLEKIYIYIHYIYRERESEFH